MIEIIRVLIENDGRLEGHGRPVRRVAGCWRARTRACGRLGRGIRSGRRIAGSRLLRRRVIQSRSHVQAVRFGLAAADRRVDVALVAGLEPFGQLGLVLGTEFCKPVLSPDIRRLDADCAVGCQHAVQVVDHLLGVGQAYLLLDHSIFASMDAAITLSHADAGEPAGHECGEKKETERREGTRLSSSDHGSLWSEPTDNDGHHRSEIGWTLPVTPAIPRGSRADCKNYLTDDAWPRGVRSVVVVQPFASLPRIANVKPGLVTTAAWRLSARSGRRRRFRVG